MVMLLEDIVQAVEMWLRLRRKQPQIYVDPNLDPVLLVPGIAGSILKAVDNENRRDERVWVRILGADYKFRTKLWSRFDPSTGRTVSLDQKTSIVVPEDRYGLHAIDMLDPDLILGRDCVYYFHDMIVEMLQWGFQEGKTLFGFGYDFRQSNRLEDTLKRLAAKLESVYEASRGKKINIITHSMGGLLVKSFMCLYSDIFEKYVKNWIAIAAPFRGAPGYVTSTFLNGVSFVDGWEQNFFISKWSMHQLLIECPSIYELMPCPDFNWQHIPVLEIWREKQDTEGNPRTILESYRPNESIEIFKEALSSNMVDYDGESIPLPFNLEILKWANETHKLLSNAELPSQVKFYNIYATGLETPHSVCYGSEDTSVTDLRQLQFFLPKYVCVDGDGTVPTESAKIIELVYQRKNIFLAKKREDYGVEYGEFIGYDMMCDYDLLKIIKDIKSSNVFSVLLSQADGLNAEARVGVPGEHRGILSDHQVFRILKHWLKADADPYYNPLNDYVILPTAFEMESHQEKGLQVTSFKEEWEIISGDQDNLDDAASRKPMVSSISISQGGKNHSSHAEAHATVTVHPQNEGKHHVELNAISVSVDA